MLKVKLRIKQNKAKQKVTVTCVAVATMQFLYGVCDHKAASDVGTGDLLLMLQAFHKHVQAYVSLGRGWSSNRFSSINLNDNLYASQSSIY